jgi:hypothetical protein
MYTAGKRLFDLPLQGIVARALLRAASGLIPTPAFFSCSVVARGHLRSALG